MSIFANMTPTEAAKIVANNIADLRSAESWVEVSVITHTPAGPVGSRLTFRPGSNDKPSGGQVGEFVAIAGDNEMTTRGYALGASILACALDALAASERASGIARQAMAMGGPESLLAALQGKPSVTLECTKGDREAGLQVMNQLDALEKRVREGKPAPTPTPEPQRSQLANDVHASRF